MGVEFWWEEGQGGGVPGGFKVGSVGEGSCV